MARGAPTVETCPTCRVEFTGSPKQRNGQGSIALSSREREVIRLVALGHSSKEIARLLAISPRTVDTYRSRLMHKLGLHSVADVVRYAVQGGMLG